MCKKIVSFMACLFCLITTYSQTTNINPNGGGSVFGYNLATNWPPSANSVVIVAVPSGNNTVDNGYTYNAMYYSQFITGLGTNSSGGGTNFVLSSILTPKMFGAVGDGVTDDTAAMTAMFNSNNISGGTMWLAGQTNLISSPLPVLTNANFNLLGGGNGAIISANGFTNSYFVAVDGSYVNAQYLQHFNIDGLSMWRNGNSRPSTNAVGILIEGLNGNPYSTQGDTISQNHIGNFWFGIKSTVDANGLLIEQNQLGQNWSNGVCLSQSDSADIAYNDLNGLNVWSANFAPPATLTNYAIAITCNSGLGLKLEGNQGGGCAQYCYIAGTRVTEQGDNWEAFASPNTNLVNGYFTNCTVTSFENTLGNVTTSNTVALIGLVNCNMQNSSFKDEPNINTFLISGESDNPIYRTFPAIGMNCKITTNAPSTGYFVYNQGTVVQTESQNSYAGFSYFLNQVYDYSGSGNDFYVGTTVSTVGTPTANTTKIWGMIAPSYADGSTPNERLIVVGNTSGGSLMEFGDRYNGNPSPTEFDFSPSPTYSTGGQFQWSINNFNAEFQPQTSTNQIGDSTHDLSSLYVNNLNFGKTNAAAVNPATPILWIPVTNGTSLYKIPLYQ
jgi:hypothetical protein